MNARQWIAEISARRKAEKDWRKDGQKILDIYGASAKVPFNILYSNTETMLPSLYSAIPKPVVDRRFKDADPIGKASSEAARRVLEFLRDTNIEGYETYDEGMRAAVVDALLPGRGVTSLKYDAEIVGDELEAKMPPAAKAAEESAEEAPVPYKSSELVCVESRKWDRFVHGYATAWSKVPYIAFCEYLDRAEVTKMAGKKVAAKLQYTAESDTDEEEGKKPNEDEQGERKVTQVWKIWDKESRKVLFVADSYADGFLKVVNDPLEVTGFFPIPKPITLIEKANDLTPSSLYALYREQAQELNDISLRIMRIVRAIKARGVYDGELGDDIRRLMEADDNELVPADKNSTFAAEKGLQNAIWFMPIVELVTVLRELMQAREACKAVIWEVVGIADIMRGTSQASETLGAQQIKQQWGSLRLKRMQKEVQRYCRDTFRIMLEIAINKFSEDTWAKMTGLPFLTTQQAMALDAQLQGMQRQMAVQPPQVDPQSGQPMPNPMEQQFQQLQQEAQKPRWSDVLAMLKDDLQRAYRIDIETNSTIEPEAADDQRNISEVMNAMGQFLAGVNPLIEQGIMPFEAAQTMLLAIVRRYRFGNEFEDQLKAMKPPQPKDDGTQQKMAMEKQKHDAEMQAQQVDQQAKQSELQQKAQLAEREAQLKIEQMNRQAEYDAQEHKYKMMELAAKTRAAEVVNASKIKVAMATAAMKEKAASQQPKETAQ